MIWCSQWLKSCCQFRCFSHPWKSRFLNLDAANTLNQIRFFLCVCPVYCGIFSIFPGLYPPDASSLFPQLGQSESPNIARCLLGTTLHPPLRTIIIKFQKVRSPQTSARRPDFMNSYRAFHSCLLFAAAININILICNFGRRLMGGKKSKNILLWYCSALNYMLLRCQ